MMSEHGYQSTSTHAHIGKNRQVGRTPVRKNNWEENEGKMRDLQAISEDLQPSCADRRHRRNRSRRDRNCTLNSMAGLTLFFVFHVGPAIEFLHKNNTVICEQLNFKKNAL